MKACDANIEETFQELNIPKLKVMASKIAKEQPSINRITIFHGAEGHPAFCLVLNVANLPRKEEMTPEGWQKIDINTTYTGPIDSMLHLDIQNIDDWSFFVELEDEVPEEFIITDFRYVIYEKTEANQAGETALINTSEKRLFGKKEIARFLSVSPDTVDKYKDQGVPIYKDKNGRLWAFPSKLNEWYQVESDKINRKK
jgi:hypothetical protein